VNGAAIVDAVVNQGGFDTTAGGVDRVTVTSVVAEAYVDQVVRARWRTAPTSLGPTVVDQGEYTLPDTVVEVDLLRVGGVPYARVGVEQLWDLRGGVRELEDAAGVFAPYFEADGDEQVALHPVPTEAGLTIEGMCVLEPAAFADDAGFAPITPTDRHPDLIERAIVLLKRRLDEIDADPGDAVWESRVEMLRRRKNSRVGQGVQRLSVRRRGR
jgi:hypothetical protein